MTAATGTRTSGDQLEVAAFAKINLTLRVFARRADGYHDLRTVFQTVELHDRLRFACVRGPFRIRANDPECPTDRSNLVWRAAEWVWKRSGRRGAPAGVAVDIDKRIPVRAGLGGGSSDAAAALRALTTLWRVPLHPAELTAAGARLGADVPFFLTGGTALGLESGNHLIKMDDHPRSWVVIVCPPVGVSTRDAYAWLDEDRAARAVRAVRVEPRRVLLDGKPEPYGRNDLQRPVARRHPVIRRLTAALRRAGARWASMSGSGSAVFGVFESREVAEAAVRCLRRPEWAVHLTRMLTAREYARRSAPASTRGGTRSRSARPATSGA